MARHRFGPSPVCDCVPALGVARSHQRMLRRTRLCNHNEVPWSFTSNGRRWEMRADDLDHKELLELDPDGGVIRFAGQRALLIDAVAMGLLRKYLVENFGLTAARTVLTQFGFAHGWRMAEAMHTEFTWESDDEWQRAGTRIHLSLIHISEPTRLL